MKQSIIPLLTAIILTFITMPLSAQNLDAREHVEVVGTASIKVVPDEFVLRATINSFDKSLNKASGENDKAVAAVFRSLSKLGIQRKYIVSDEIVVNSVTEGYRSRGNFRHLGYDVSREVMVILHEAKTLEPAMKKLFSAGVDRLTVAMGHTKMKGLLENAQIKAAGEAKRKATLLSSALGRKVGKAVTITEASRNPRQPQSFVYTADTPDLGDTISLGKITVEASVNVKFLLS